MQKPLLSRVSTAVIGVLATTTIQAAGFSLYTEGSGASIGTYGAGLAAEAADASTGWFNPAGLSLINEQQAVVGVVGIFPTTSLTGTTTYNSTGFPSYSEAFRNLNGGEDAGVPSFHYAKPVGENTTVGLSIVAPFGLSTNWGNRSPLRYSATFTELLTVNISPEIGGKVNENFAIGAGLDLQYAKVKFNRMLGSPAVLNAIGNPPNQFDSLSYNKGQSFGVGFHAGILAMFNDNHTRVGLNYQSKMKHTFHGYSVLTGILADPALTNPNAIFRTDSLYSNNIEFPEVVALSGYHEFNEKFTLLGSIIYTGWHVFDDLALFNVAAPLPGGGIAPAISSSTQNYRNAWRFGLGANYHVNERFMLRGGIGYDETPTNDVDRDVRLPDVDRWALAVGAHYDFNPEFGFDIGYAYLWGRDDSRVNKTEAIGTTNSFNVNARGDNHAHLVGLQAVWTLDRMPEPVPTK